MSQLADTAANIEALGRAGAVAAMVDLTRHQKRGVVDAAVLALAKLSSRRDTHAQLTACGGVTPVVNVLRTGSSAAKRSAGRVLIALSVSPIESSKSALVQGRCLRVLFYHNLSLCPFSVCLLF